MDPTAEQTIQTFVTLVSTWVLPVAQAIVVLLIGRFASGVARKTVRAAMTRHEIDASLIPFLSNIVYYTLLAAVIIAVLGIFGIETTSLVAVLGTIGLAVGLALQGTLSNLSSGIMLLLVRPWCRREDYWSLRCDLMRRFKEELEQAGCSIPYSQQDIHIHQTSGAA